MDKTKMIQQLMGTFLEELEEHVRAFNQDLLALEKVPTPAERAERFKTLFRTAHSLKGAARSVSVGLIEAACHRLEEILSKAREDEAVLGPELIALFFAAVDAIEEAGMRLREQQDLADAPLAALLPRLDAALGKTAPSIAAPAPRVAASVKNEVAPEIAPSLPRALVADAPPEPATASGSVRVPAEKLDTLLARVGELLVAQRRAEARAGDLTALRDFIDRWRTEWKRVEPVFTKERLANGQGGMATADRLPRTIPRRAAQVLRQTGDNLRWLDKAFDRFATALSADSRLLAQVTHPLDDEVRRVRMLPFSDACAGLDRMVRDLAQARGKDVELVIDGGSVELDRSILEGLKDPLRHLVRNAIDHGVEVPADRLTAGKRGTAQIRVSAALRGAQVEVRVQDDGRGLDLEAIRAQVRRRRLEEPADERDLARMIFVPGFSTAAIITDVSGRGVGLDVVKNRVEALHGTVDLAFTAKQGTQFTLTVPLTLTTLRAVLVKAGGQTYAFAGTNVHKMVYITAADIRTVAGHEVLPLDGAALPLASLQGVLFPALAAELPSGKIPAVIVASGTVRMALLVDELLAEQEILIKSLGARIRRVPFVAGATLLPSGQIALVLNAANLVGSALRQGAVSTRRAVDRKEAQGPAKNRLLVVEDSVTTRTLMKSILEAAGYDVAAVVDGRAAWLWLQEHEADLVVSDVDMPNMDGFELTANVRASDQMRDLPVVLVTARENETDKTRGIEAGANAYLVKSAFEQRSLLETIAQLL
jgi:two-component system, chemotaxis family, sensor kinase CheA